MPVFAQVHLPVSDDGGAVQCDKQSRFYEIVSQDFLGAI